MNTKPLLEQIVANKQATDAQKTAPRMVNLAAMSHEELVALAESSVGRNIALQDLLLRADTMLNDFIQKLGKLSAEHVELQKEADDMCKLLMRFSAAQSSHGKSIASRHIRAWAFKKSNGAK